MRADARLSPQREHPDRGGVNPELEATAAEIADLEVLIEARPARAATLRPVIEDLRARQANQQRGARRQAHAKLAAEIPAEQAYRAAVAEMSATLEGSRKGQGL